MFHHRKKINEKTCQKGTSIIKHSIKIYFDTYFLSISLLIINFNIEAIFQKNIETSINNILMQIFKYHLSIVYMNRRMPSITYTLVACKFFHCCCTIHVIMFALSCIEVCSVFRACLCLCSYTSSLSCENYRDFNYTLVK